MRRLADELGVGTMTLYGYFRSKSELLDARDGRVGDRRGRRCPTSGPWRERIAALARAMRAGSSATRRWSRSACSRR